QAAEAGDAVRLQLVADERATLGSARGSGIAAAARARRGGGAVNQRGGAALAGRGENVHLVEQHVHLARQLESKPLQPQVIVRAELAAGVAVDLPQRVLQERAAPAGDQL